MGVASQKALQELRYFLSNRPKIRLRAGDRGTHARLSGKQTPARKPDFAGERAGARTQDPVIKSYGAVVSGDFIRFRIIPVASRIARVYHGI